MKLTPQDPIIGYLKNPYSIPENCIQVNSYYELWNYNNPRYPIFLKNTNKGLIDSIENRNKVDFFNEDLSGGGVIRKIGDIGFDHNYNCIAVVYNKYDNEIAYFMLYASENRFGGIIIQPVKSSSDVFKQHRHKFLLNKFTRLSLLIGKICLFIKNIYIEISFRPGGQGYIVAQQNFCQLANSQ